MSHVCACVHAHTCGQRVGVSEYPQEAWEAENEGRDPNSHEHSDKTWLNRAKETPRAEPLESRSCNIHKRQLEAYGKTENKGVKTDIQGKTKKID